MADKPKGPFLDPELWRISNQYRQDEGFIFQQLEPLWPTKSVTGDDKMNFEFDPENPPKPRDKTPATIDDFERIISRVNEIQAELLQRIERADARTELVHASLVEFQKSIKDALETIDATLTIDGDLIRGVERKILQVDSKASQLRRDFAETNPLRKARRLQGSTDERG